MIKLVGARGFEPPTTWPPAKYATRLRYAPKVQIITEQKKSTDKNLGKVLLKMEAGVGIEPAYTALQAAA